jgi:hypothetical protein
MLGTGSWGLRLIVEMRLPATKADHNNRKQKQKDESSNDNEKGL